MRNKKLIIIAALIIVAIVLLGSGTYVIKNKFDNKISGVNSSEETVVDNSQIDEEEKKVNTEDGEKEEVIKNEDIAEEDEKEVETTGTSEGVIEEKEEKNETSNSTSSNNGSYTNNSSTNSATNNNISYNNAGSSNSDSSSNNGVSTPPVTTPDPIPTPAPQPPTPEPTPEPTQEPEVSVATGISFADLLGRLPDMGFDSSGYYKENGIRMGRIYLNGSKLTIGLEQNGAQFNSVINNCLNLLLPTQGNILYNIVSNPFSNQTLTMDGRTVEIKLFSEGVIINMYE